MKNQEKAFQSLQNFNNRSLTKQQWDIILKGCGCPKSAHFWTALRKVCLNKTNKVYTLLDIDIHTYACVLEEYRSLNNYYVNKHIQKIKARKKAKAFKGIVFYIVNGVLTTENPRIQ